MVTVPDEEIIALEESDDEVAPCQENVNAFMDGDSDAIDYNADDPEDEDAYEADPALHMMMKIQMRWKWSEATMQKQWNCPRWLGRRRDLNEEDDEFSDDDAETSEEE